MTSPVRSVRTVAPASTLVSVAEVKAAQRIDASDEDALIETWIKAASVYVETSLSRAIVAQTWRHDFAGWVDRELRLGLPDTQSAVVTYTDATGATQTLAASQYDLIEDGLGTVIRAKVAASWPGVAQAPTPISVTAVHGIAALDPARDPIRQALFVIVGDWMNYRESAAAGNVVAPPIAVTVDRLLVEYRARWMAA